MKAVLRNTFLAAAALSASMAQASVIIDFDNPDSYKSTGIYDVWENSPFRTGELTGNREVVDNPDKSINPETGQPFNASGKVLGAQRSRFGSNRFGVRVDLNEPWEINPTTQYVHVLLHKPKAGRVMLVGLGSRKERTGQNPYTEQFWELSSNNVGTDQWYDAVFPVKGANGVEVRSLVLVPDCESPHNLAEDFIFYIDDIEISSSPMSRIMTEYYPIAGSKETTGINRDDKFASAVGVTVNGEGKQEFKIDQKKNKLLYQDLTSSMIYAKPGDTLTPFIDYTGNWMHSYCYVDYNNDGNFSANVTDGATPAWGSEIVSYNYYDGKDSHGNEVKHPELGEKVGKLPSFNLPKNLKPGIYRMRFKVDWNCADPLGNAASNNKISDNGGMIADVLLCVDQPEVEVNDHQLNGEVVAANGAKLNAYKIKPGEPFTIKVVPEKGFHNGGVSVKTGYNLDSDEVQDRHGNTQYIQYSISPEEFSADGTYTIPGEKVHGNILINGTMLEN